MAQGIGIILIFVATGDLKDALADQSVEGVLAASFAPVGDEGGDQVAEAGGLVSLSKERQAAIGGEATAIKGNLQGQRGRGGERRGRYGRMV